MAKKNSVPKGKFPTMGTSAASTVVNVSGAPSRNTKTVAKKGSSGGMLEAATASHRPGVLERMGASLHPTATLYAQNAAEASATQRNTRLVPSSLGNRDFFLRRRYGQGV